MYSAQRNAHEDPLSLKSGLTLKDDVEEPWQRLRVLRQRMPPPRPSFCSVREPPKSHDSVRSFNVAPQQPELEFPSLLRERRGTSSAGTPVSTQEVLMDHVEPEVAEPWQRLRIFRQTKSIPRPDFVNPPRLISGQRSQSDSMLAKQHTGGAGEIVAFKRASPRAQRLERDQRIQVWGHVESIIADCSDCTRLGSCYFGQISDLSLYVGFCPFCPCSRASTDAASSGIRPPGYRLGWLGVPRGHAINNCEKRPVLESSDSEICHHC